VTLVPDALAPGTVAAADAVIVGADAVTPRALWNKCGTLGLALAARAARRPLLVVTATDRLVGHTLASRLTNVEVASRRGNGVETAATLFEPVPLPLVARVITERSALRPGVLSRRLTRAGAARWWTRPPA
jgi:translation initiation factor 2B subunit (eIF-2B alpha/beta/delta family)